MKREVKSADGELKELKNLTGQIPQRKQKNYIIKFFKI